ncbi:MAG: hypothetical protein ACQESP_11510, partial [Candidatus Muiribacteriota bacterium]
DSIQLVGPNNVGKSSLIYSLNYLYIINENIMSFSGNRSGGKITNSHYFNHFNQSFLIFEVFKKRYYMILVRKNINGTVNYYKIDRNYQDEFFIEKTEQGQKIKSFNEIEKDFSVSGINFEKFNEKQAFFNFVYQKGGNNNGVVWINEKVSKKRNLSNTFSNIYKYLISPELIDNKALKESLIIADNKETLKADFSKKYKHNLDRLYKIKNEIDHINYIKKDFNKYKRIVSDYQDLNNEKKIVIFKFFQESKTIIESLSLELKDTKKKFQDNEVKLSEFEEKKEKLLIQKGGLDKDLKQNQKQCDELTTKINKIRNYGWKEYLIAELNKIKNQKKDLEIRFQKIDDKNLTIEVIEKKLDELKKKIKSIEIRIFNYSESFLSKISDNHEVQEKLNAILSDSFLYQADNQVNKKIKTFKKEMAIFDGEIILPDNFVGKKLDSVQDLKIKLADNQRELKNKKQILKDITIKTNLRNQIEEFEDQIYKTKSRINDMDNLPGLVKDCDNLKALILELKKEYEEVLNGIEEFKDKIEDIKSLNRCEENKIQKLSSDLDEVRRKKGEVEQIQNEAFTAIDYSSKGDIKSLDQFYSKIIELKKKLNSLYFEKQIAAEPIKNSLNFYSADDQELIDYVEAEISTVEEKEDGVLKLIESVSAQFANPSGNLCLYFDEFKTFIHHQFNRRLKSIKISNIENLKIEINENKKILSDLKKISMIKDISSENNYIFEKMEDSNENLALLEKYIDEGAKITFAQLFDISLTYDHQGFRKKADLKNQVESDGTDRLLRIVLILSIIKYLIQDHPENKLIIFIDEIGTIDTENLIEIINFCKKNNFFPISAAPTACDGFSKYYNLFENSADGSLLVGEEFGNVVWG